MSNEPTPEVPAGQPKPGLPQFDPGRPGAVDDTQQLPAARTSEIPVTPPATPYAYAASSGDATPIAGPGVPLSPTGLPPRDPWVRQAGVREPGVRDAAAPTDGGSRWNAKKTAVTAGLVLVLTSAGAIAAAAAMPSGSTGDDSGFRGPGGGRSFPFPGGQRGLQNQQGQQDQQDQQGTSPQQLPNLQNGLPGGGLSGLDPNQLSQLDPQDLLRHLGLDDQSGQGTQGTQGGQGSDPFSDGQDDSGSSTTGGARTT